MIHVLGNARSRSMQMPQRRHPRGKNIDIDSDDEFISLRQFDLLLFHHLTVSTKVP